MNSNDKDSPVKAESCNWVKHGLTIHSVDQFSRCACLSWCTVDINCVIMELQSIIRKSSSSSNESMVKFTTWLAEDITVVQPYTDYSNNTSQY